MAATKKQPARETGTAQATKQAEGNNAADELAQHIAAVLNHPDLPDCLEEAIGEGLNEVFNQLPNQLWKRMEYSPAYISLLLSAHKKGGAR